jgi:hypothetical protein
VLLLEPVPLLKIARARWCEGNDAVGIALHALVKGLVHLVPQLELLGRERSRIGHGKLQPSQGEHVSTGLYGKFSGHHFTSFIRWRRAYR